MDIVGSGHILGSTSSTLKLLDIDNKSWMTYQWDQVPLEDLATIKNTLITTWSPWNINIQLPQLSELSEGRLKRISIEVFQNALRSSIFFRNTRGEGDGCQCGWHGWENILDKGPKSSVASFAIGIRGGLEHDRFKFWGPPKPRPLPFAGHWGVKDK